MSNSYGFLRLLLAASVFGLCLMPSCKKDNGNYAINYQNNYFPLDSGNYIIYNVDSITYNYNQLSYERDTVRFQWMRVVGDTFYDNQNRLSYKIYIYRRPDSTYSNWTIDRVWYATPATTNMQLIEDDLRFIKLIFPPALNETWGGNLYVPATANDQYSVFQNWNYYYENTDTTYIMNGLTFNNSLVVSEVNQQNLINKTLRTEVYVQNVGMIYEEWEALSKTIVSTDWNTGPESGFRIRMYAWKYHE
jgi:hypothetical protein